MSRITMCIEEEFSGKVIGSFDLTEYADKVYNQALEDFAEKILNWKAPNEEYRSFKDVVNEVKNQLIK